jgi:hypothetical protein
MEERGISKIVSVKFHKTGETATSVETTAPAAELAMAK